MITLRSMMIAATVLGSFGAAVGASAQQPATAPATPPAATPAPSPATTPRTTAPSAEARPGQIVSARELERGANSFTEGQAQSRFEDAGFSNITGLAKDEAGFWRGRGMRGGVATDLALDFRGRIAAGPEVVALPREAPAQPRSSATTPAPATSTR